MSALVQALQALYAPSASPELRRQADQWLVEFQRSPGSWSQCADILSAGTASQEVLLFAAQTIRYKAARQLGQVAIEQLPAIRDHICSSLLLPQAQSPPIIQQLCLALVAVAFHWQQWCDVVEHTAHRLPPQLCVEFLYLLAEEAREEFGSRSGSRSSSSGGSLDHGSVRSRAGSWAQSAFATLQHALQLAASGGDARLLAQVLRCLGSWAKLGALHEHQAAAAATPLIAAAIQGLNSSAPQVRGDDMAAACAQLFLHPAALRRRWRWRARVGRLQWACRPGADR
jgi:hypothetical protein